MAKRFGGKKIRSHDRPAPEIFLPVNFFAKLLELADAWMKTLLELTLQGTSNSHVKKDHEYREEYSAKRFGGKKIRNHDRPAPETFLPVNFFAKLLGLADAWMKVLSELTSWDKHLQVKKDHEYREGFGKKIWGQKNQKP